MGRHSGRKEYLREYQKAWAKSRRDSWIKDNGPCSHCGSSINLQVDHIDFRLKEFSASQLWSRSEKIREKELKKCQVLCGKCHLEKSKKEGSLKINKLVGELNPSSKLTDKDVRYIKMILETKVPIRVIGRLFGVSHQVIMAIRDEKSWAHINSTIK